MNLSGHIVLWKKQKWELCIGLKYGAELIVRMSPYGTIRSDEEEVHKRDVREAELYMTFSQDMQMLLR